jgi:uncharacterized protein YllA (UPF0747 family)
MNISDLFRKLISQYHSKTEAFALLLREILKQGGLYIIWKHLAADMIKTLAAEAVDKKIEDMNLLNENRAVLHRLNAVDKNMSFFAAKTTRLQNELDQLRGRNVEPV